MRGQKKWSQTIGKVLVAGFSKAWNPKAVNPFSSNAKVEFNDKIEKLSEPNQLYQVFLEGLSS